MTAAVWPAPLIPISSSSGVPLPARMYGSSRRHCARFISASATWSSPVSLVTTFSTSEPYVSTRPCVATSFSEAEYGASS